MSYEQYNHLFNDKNSIPFSRQDACDVGVISAVVIGCIQKHGHAMTPDEIAKAIRVRTVYTVRRHLKKLVALSRLEVCERNGRVAYGIKIGGGK